MITYEQLTHRYTIVMLELNNGNKTKTAKAMGVSTKTLSNWLKKFSRTPIDNVELDASSLNDEVLEYILPSNEERLAYLDKWPSRYK